MKNKSIILIGMPGSGKTTIGKMISKTLNMSWIDTDQLIKKFIKIDLSEYVKHNGREQFNIIQEKIIIENKFNNFIVSTGGGVVFSENIMEHFKKFGNIFYLNEKFDDLYYRLDKNRSLAPDRESFYEIYKQRCPLYTKYSDYIIDSQKKSKTKIVEEIVNIYNNGVN